MAQKMAEAIEADLLELKPEKDIAKKGFMRYLQGGSQALRKEQPDLLSLEKNPEDYDFLCLGTPVWAGTYAPALNTLFNVCFIKKKKVALFCCHGGGKGKVFEKMKARLEDNEFLGEIDFQDPLKRNKDADIERMKKWTEQLF